MTEAIGKRLSQNGKEKIMLWEPRLGLPLSHFRVIADEINHLPLCLAGLPSHLYHACQAFSSHYMQALFRCPAWAKWCLEHPPEDKPAYRVGRAIHSAVLGVDWDQYVRLPDLNLRSNAGREEREWYQQTYGAEFCLPPDEYDLAQAISSRLWNHPEAKKCLSACEYQELSLFWEEAGVLSKARLDCVSLEAGVAFDLKSTTDASEKAFLAECRERHYDWQACHYLEGCKACNLPISRWMWIAVEKSPPHLVGIYALGTKTLEEQSRPARQAALELLRSCLASGVWPDYSENGFKEVELY